MPKLNDPELLKKVKELNPNVKSKLIGAFEIENEPNFQGAVKEGVIDKFIQKPVTMNYLCQEVNKQVDPSF